MAAIGVMGCVRELPSGFPTITRENSGNMIHGNAPFEMFPHQAVHSSDVAAIAATGSGNFVDFVNKNCSHLVLTMANTLRLGETDGARFSRLQRMLEKVERPVVVFGLGVQSQSDDIDTATLPEEAVSLMQYLSSRSPALGVRGLMTKHVLEKLCGVTNAFVTGCPSMFSRPDMLAKLPENLERPSGRPAFNGTKYHFPEEKSLLIDAIRSGYYLVEPVNRFNHEYYLSCINGGTEEKLPYFLKGFRDDMASEIAGFFRNNYRIFRNVNTWYDFNAEAVSYTYGTRFHVNMASVLSGIPALWITHDARTRELVDFLHLPAVSLEESLESHPEQLLKGINYDDFFAHIDGLFDNFNEYLAINGLPGVRGLRTIS